MSYYSLALFLHVCGALGAFVSIGVWLFDLAALRRAGRVEQVRAIAWLIVVMSPLMVGSVLTIVGAGLFMTLTVWGFQTSWIAVSLASLALMAPIGPFVLDTRIRAIWKLAGAAPDGLLSVELQARIRDPILSLAAHTLASLLLGIVFLMTTKPPFVTAILTMPSALVLGLLSSVPVIRSRQRRSTGQNVTASDPFQRATFWTRRW